MKDILITPEEYEEIESYLNGELSPETSAAFRHRLDTDESWRAKVEQVRVTITAIREKVLTEQLSKIPLSNKLVVVAHSNKKRRLLYIGLLAAAAVVIFLIVSPILTHMAVSGNQKLFSEYYYPDAGLVTAMGLSDNYEFDRAMVDYKSGKYSEANQRWMNLLQLHPASDTLNYFIASSYLAMGEAAKSIDYFKKIVNNKESAFSSDANWYLGLALLQTGNYNDAIHYISISDNENKGKLLKDMEDLH
ncbi:MAG: hypothetical protein J5I50_09485 [Chitinophagaceae bacterium]|nr:hypothetical protein [Chitinophagaceae bacterium]